MLQDNAPDFSAIEHWLVTARITSLQHWDMLVFLYRHQTSLVSAEHIARLLGHAIGEAVAALDHLESLGFVTRSRASQGVRLYQFTAPVNTPPGDACHRLMRVADSRAVRRLLTRRWRRGDRRSDNNNRYAGWSSLSPWTHIFAPLPPSVGEGWDGGVAARSGVYAPSSPPPQPSPVSEAGRQELLSRDIAGEKTWRKAS